MLAEGKKLASGSSDATVRIWDVETAATLQVLAQHTGWVLFLRERGQHIISGSRDNTIRVWDYEEGKCLEALEGHMGAVRVMDWVGEGKLASGSSDGMVKVWAFDQNGTAK